MREIRAEANRQIEVLRSQGVLGSSLQAELTLAVKGQDLSLLRSLGEDAKFVFITSGVEIGELGAAEPESYRATPRASAAIKCDRCWHYRADVGHNAAHPTICSRCTTNLYGAGEIRTVA